MVDDSALTRFAALAIVSILACAPMARAQAEDLPAAPLYPEIIVPTDARYSGDAALNRLRADAAEASEAKVETSGARVYDPTALLPFMAAEVEFFIGPREGLSRNGFTSLGTHPAAKALEMLGSMSRHDAGPDASVRQRYAMYAVKRMLADPSVGVTPWLDGRICTASYGEVTWPDWRALKAGPGMSDFDWVIAAAIDREGIEDAAAVPEDWPKPYQVVPVSHDQKASADWLGIVAPSGETVFFRSLWDDNASHFAPYLNDHLCFEQGADGWKITAIAKRMR